MTTAKEAYETMIRELVADGITDFDNVEPALAEIIAWARFGIADNPNELLEAAEGWHWDKITAAWQHGHAEEVQRLVKDGMRVIMSSRYSRSQRRMVKGPVQADIDAELERTGGMIKRTDEEARLDRCQRSRDLRAEIARTTESLYGVKS